MQAPTAIAVFPKEIWTYPKSWCAKQYNLKRWTIMPAGGESGLFHSASCPLLLHMIVAGLQRIYAVEVA